MINWKELEKFITPGKVCTIVILVDGNEIGAFSFNIETLAYKEALEATEKAPVIIAEKAAEKPAEKKVETKKPEAKKPADKYNKTGRHPEFNPVPATDENTPKQEDDQDKDKDDFDDNDSGIDIKTGADKATGEIKEKITPDDINHGKETVSDAIRQEYENSLQPENIAKRSHPVAAAVIEDDDIIPEETVIVDKKEIVNGKDEKVQAPPQAGNPEINFSDEKW